MFILQILTLVCVFFYLNVMWFALFCAESSNIGLRSAPACSFFPIGRCECVRLCVYACVHEHWTVWKVFFFVCLFYSQGDWIAQSYCT